MNAVIGTYNNLDKGMAALMELKEAGFPINNLSLLGKLDAETNGGHYGQNGTTITVNRVSSGIAISRALEVVDEASVFSIPEYGFLFAGGGVTGMVSQFIRDEAGIPLSSILNRLGLNEDVTADYVNGLGAGKYLIIAHGDHDNITKATQILEKHITYAEAEGDKVHKFNIWTWLKNINTDFPLAG